MCIHRLWVDRITHKEAVQRKINTILVGITVGLLLSLPAAASDHTLGVFGNANAQSELQLICSRWASLLLHFFSLACIHNLILLAISLILHRSSTRANPGCVRSCPILFLHRLWSAHVCSVERGSQMRRPRRLWM